MVPISVAARGGHADVRTEGAARHQKVSEIARVAAAEEAHHHGEQQISADDAPVKDGEAHPT